MPDQARFLKKKGKKIGSPNLDSTGLNQVQNEFFCHFIEFGSHVFFEIAYNDSLHLTISKYLTSSRRKTLEKKLGGSKFGPNGPKSDPKLGFSPFS